MCMCDCVWLLLWLVMLIEVDVLCWWFGFGGVEFDIYDVIV